MKISFIFWVILLFLIGCDAPHDSLQTNNVPLYRNLDDITNTHRSFDNSRTDENKPDPEAVEQARMRKELSEHQTKFADEQALLKQDYDAYKWSEQHKRYFDSQPSEPTGRERQAELIGGSKSINDTISTLQNLIKNADFPKTNKEWKLVVGDLAHKYNKIYYDFLIDFRPGGSDDKIWDYNNIIDMAKKQAKEIDAILNNPYTTKTTNYKTLKTEIENINKNKKDAFVKYNKYTERLEKIADVLAISRILKTDFADLIGPL